LGRNAPHIEMKNDSHAMCNTRSDGRRGLRTERTGICTLSYDAKHVVRRPSGPAPREPITQVSEFRAVRKALQGVVSTKSFWQERSGFVGAPAVAEETVGPQQWLALNSGRRPGGPACPKVRCGPPLRIISRPATPTTIRRMQYSPSRVAKPSI